MLIVSPRFDSWWQATLNLVAISVFLVIAGEFIWSCSRGRKLRWRDLLLIINVSVAGLYLPVFPLVWLVKERDKSRMPDGSVRWPLGVTTRPEVVSDTGWSSEMGAPPDESTPK